MNRATLVALTVLAAAALAGAALLLGIPIFGGPPRDLDLRLTLDAGGESRSVTMVDGTPIERPSQGFTIYGNAEVLGVDRVAVGMPWLAEHGVPLPGTDSRGETLGSLQNLLRGSFGLQGEIVRDDHERLDEPPFHTTDLLMSHREVPLQADLFHLAWRTPDRALDSFALLIVGPLDGTSRRGALIRFRSDTGVLVTGWSASGNEEIDGGTYRSHWSLTPHLHPFPLPREEAATVFHPVEGVESWWIERFPPGRPLR